jgi:hypothetical protein
MERNGFVIIDERRDNIIFDGIILMNKIVVD